MSPRTAIVATGVLGVVVVVLAVIVVWQALSISDLRDDVTAVRAESTDFDNRLTDIGATSERNRDTLRVLRTHVMSLDCRITQFAPGETSFTPPSLAQQCLNTFELSDEIVEIQIPEP